MATANPFKPAEQARPLVRCLVYGPAGIGKTYFALSVPGKLAYIDTEGSTLHYAGRPGVSPFDRILTKSYREAMAAIAYLAANPGDYTAVVIDPISVLYETLQDTAQHRRATAAGDVDADLQMLDWGRIKRSNKSLLTALANLPMHVIAVARQKDEMEKRGSEMVRVGVKFDAEKQTDYWFDTVLRFGKAREGEAGPDGVARLALVEKDRAASHPVGSTLPNPTFSSVFGAYLSGSSGARTTIVLPDAAETAASDAAAEEGTSDRPTPAQVVALVEALEAAGQDPEVIKAQVAGKGQPWSALTVRQVTGLTERAIAAAARAKAAQETPPEPTAAPTEAAAGEPTPAPSPTSDATGDGGVPAQPSPVAAPPTSRRRTAAAAQPVEA
jgi:hypothetical protein